METGKNYHGEWGGTIVETGKNYHGEWGELLWRLGGGGGGETVVEIEGKLLWRLGGTIVETVGKPL